MRIKKLEALLKEKDFIINERDEKILLLQKMHLDEEEEKKDLAVEVKRLRRQVEELEEAANLDASEDEVREHKIRKLRHKVKEYETTITTITKKYDALVHMEIKFHELEDKYHHLEERFKHVDQECHMWEEKCHKIEAKYHDVYGKIVIYKKKIEELEISIKGHDVIILEWEEKCKSLDDRIHHYMEEITRWEKKCHEWETKCHEWEEKCHHLEISIKGHDHIILEWEEKCKGLDGRIHHYMEEITRWEKKCHGLEDELHKLRDLKDRCSFLEIQIKEWSEKYEHLEKRCYEWEQKWHHSEEMCWKLKEVITHLKAECHRIRDHAHHRIHDLADKVKTFCRTFKECSCLMEKFEGLCHVEDIMREEVVVEKEVHEIQTETIVEYGTRKHGDHVDKTKTEYTITKDVHKGGKGGKHEVEVDVIEETDVVRRGKYGDELVSVDRKEYDYKAKY